jgi:hypothetical protein
MTAHHIPATAPANSIPVWSDGNRIFALIGDCILAFPLTEGGLSKVLMLLKQRPVNYTTTRTHADERTERAKVMLRKLGALG